MSELKPCPCPICGAELKIYGPEDWHPTFYDPDSGGDPYNAVCDCGFQFSNGSCNYAEFVAALNRRTQPANEPLTMEELRGMDGEPVWTVNVSSTEDGTWEMWDIVEKSDDEGIEFGYSTEHKEWWNYNLRNGDGTLCGCSWLAYRRPPERSENG